MEWETKLGDAYYLFFSDVDMKTAKELYLKCNFSDSFEKALDLMEINWSYSDYYQST